MKRLLPLLVCWLAVLTAPVQAQYILITLDLNKFSLNQNQNQPGTGTPGQPGSTPTTQPATPPPTTAQPAPAQPGDPSQAGQTEPEQPLLVHAILEAKNVQPFPLQQSWLVTHKWGTSKVPFSVIKQIHAFSIPHRFTEEKKAQGRDWKKSTSKTLHLAEWALRHGLLSEYVKLMTDLGKLDANLPEVKNFIQIHALLKESPKTLDPRAQSVVKDLEHTEFKAIPSKEGHYTLMTRLKAEDPEVVNRLQLLENTYHNFFYWFALKGKVIEPPRYQLVAVLESKEEEIKGFLMAYGYPPMVGDGFMVPRAQAMILFNKRLDPLFERLDRDNQNHWNNFTVSGADLLSGAAPTQQQPQLQQYAPALQTLALVRKVLLEEGERATVTHEAVRQLLSATGLVPHNVAAGEWLRFGIASFFETPHHALFTGTALPNWKQLVNFKYYRQLKKLPDTQAGYIFQGVITDEWFRQAFETEQQARATTDVKSPLKQKATEQLEIARATSWAAGYYLLNQRLDGVFAYMDELRKLPRDVEHDAPVLAGCFARAFNLSAATADNPNAVNLRGLETLANDWYRRTSGTTLDVLGLEQDLLQARLQPPSTQQKTSGSGTGSTGLGGTLIRPGN